MALISLLLGLRKGKSLRRFEGGFETPDVPVYDQPLQHGVRCANKNCIVHEPKESPYVRNKFHVVESADRRGCKLRCVYCETDIDRFVVAHKKSKWYADDTSLLLQAKEPSREFLAFAEEADAASRGYHSRRQAAPPPREASNSHS